MDDLKNMNIEKVARAVELDAGQALPGLRESLAQAKRGEFAVVHTPEQIAARSRGRPTGSVQASTRRPTTLRLDEAALARWRASGKGWQTRAAAVLAKHAP